MVSCEGRAESRSEEARVSDDPTNLTRCLQTNFRCW